MLKKTNGLFKMKQGKLNGRRVKKTYQSEEKEHKVWKIKVFVVKYLCLWCI